MRRKKGSSHRVQIEHASDKNQVILKRNPGEGEDCLENPIGVRG